jgi:hypothetical protein
MEAATTIDEAAEALPMPDLIANAAVSGTWYWTGRATRVRALEGANEARSARKFQHAISAYGRMMESELRLPPDYPLWLQRPEGAVPVLPEADVEGHVADVSELGRAAKEAGPVQARTAPMRSMVEAPALEQNLPRKAAKAAKEAKEPRPPKEEKAAKPEAAEPQQRKHGGLPPDGTILFANFKGKRVEAEISSGQVVVGDQSFGSLSAAAKYACEGCPRNGLTFWKIAS